MSRQFMLTVTDVDDPDGDFLRRLSWNQMVVRVMPWIAVASSEEMTPADQLTFRRETAEALLQAAFGLANIP